MVFPNEDRGSRKSKGTSDEEPGMAMKKSFNWQHSISSDHYEEKKEQIPIEPILSGWLARAAFYPNSSTFVTSSKGGRNLHTGLVCVIFLTWPLFHDHRPT